MSGDRLLVASYIHLFDNSGTVRSMRFHWGQPLRSSTAAGPWAAAAPSARGEPERTYGRTMATVSQSPEVVAAAPVAQPVLTALTPSAVFLVLTIEDGGEPVVQDLLADLSGLARTVGFRAPQGGLAVVAGVGSAAWDRLFAGPRPADLHPFRALDGDRHQAPATPGDLLFHIRAATMDLCWELASLVVGRLAGSATVVDEVQGFKYFDERDLLGFVDGTENPSGSAAEAAVTIGAEDPAFAGGSYVIVQKYLHDMGAWEGLTVEEQERVVGRAKLSNVEMADDVKPANSHVALNTIEEPDGTQRQILRDNMPFGSLGAGEFGTYFIGYAATPAVTELMLQHMFIGDPPGNYDRILDFSTAVTGTLFFVPTADFLDDPPPLPGEAGGSRALAGGEAAAPGAPGNDPAPPDEGSLGIGGLEDKPA
ncbi:MAG TPA: Dyp-type peroxidase [Acidimicrobiales bacterium]|nr:Dyp-type peroxidase [Acidimicrobiales bacterium]